MLWLAALSDEERSEIEPKLLERRFRRGEAIVAQGDPSANVWLLDAGHVAVQVATPHGDSITTTVLGPGSGFGEVAHLSGEDVRTASVVALDRVSARVLPSRAFDELRRRVPEVDRAIAEELALRLRDLSDRFAEITSESVQRRCGRRLVELAGLFAAPGERGGVVPLTQDDLAGLVGATRPTVNQVIGALAEEGLLRLHRGSVEVVDRERLRSFVR